MKITVITLFPQMLNSFFNESILKRAQEKGTVEVNVVDLRSFAKDSYKSVDDRPYGGGAGMILRVDILSEALKDISGSRVVLTSARGKSYSQQCATEYAKLEHLVIVAGHYEGFDERITELVDEEVSIGDYILTGGELPAAVIVDSVVRLLPGTLKKEEATQIESFFKASILELINVCGEDTTLRSLKESGKEYVQLLEYPQYTRPEEFEGKKVPEILLSGHHKEIELWRLRKAYEVTKERRPDLLK